MKQLILLATFIFCGIAAFSQTTPQLNQTAYLTNLNGKVMQAYPNPAVDQVIIQHVSSTERAVMYVVSTDGKILVQQTVMPNTLQTKINVGLLSRGIYIVKYDDARGDVRTLKLVKN